MGSSPTGQRLGCNIALEISYHHTGEVSLIQCGSSRFSDSNRLAAGGRPVGPDEEPHCSSRLQGLGPWAFSCLLDR